MIPMNANPIRICPIVLATAQGQGAISWRLPNGGTVTPWSGSTTAPLASVKSPYNTGPPVGMGRVVGAAGMFPTFWTATPTCRSRAGSSSEYTRAVRGPEGSRTQPPSRRRSLARGPVRRSRARARRSRAVRPRGRGRSMSVSSRSPPHATASLELRVELLRVLEPSQHEVGGRQAGDDPRRGPDDGIHARVVPHIGERQGDRKDHGVTPPPVRRNVSSFFLWRRKWP